MSNEVLLALTPVALIGLLIVLLIVAHARGYEISYDSTVSKMPKLYARQKRDDNQARVALERMTEVAKGLRGVVEVHTDQALKTWFDSLCTSVAWTLATDNSEVYRVAIWTVHPDNPDELLALAWELHPSHDDSWRRLDRKTSLAGKALAERAPYYCHDTATDPEYKRRRADGPPPAYGSVLALPLGEKDRWWGAMTIDARAKEGFTEQDQRIAVQFGELASIGADLGAHQGTNIGDTPLSQPSV